MADVQANTASEFTVFNVEEGDRLGWALHTSGNQEVLLLSADGQSIRFGEDDVRVMGLPAGGVGGMKLRGKDRLVFAGVVDPAGELATISAQGFAKRTSLGEYSSQGRNGGGILAHKLVERTGKLGAGLLLPPQADEDSVILVSVKGVAKPITVADIQRMGRAASGRQILSLAEKDTVTAAWRIGGAKGPGDGGGTDERTTAAAEETASPAPRKQAARQSVPPEQVELLEEAAAVATAKPQTAKVPAVAASLPLKRAKDGTTPATEKATPQLPAKDPAKAPRETPVVKAAEKAAATAAEKPVEKPAEKAEKKTAEKTAAKHAGKPVAQAPAKSPVERKPETQAGAETKTGTRAKPATEAKPPLQAKPQAPAKQVTPSKPASVPVVAVETAKKTKPSSKPTPAEIASGTRGGTAKQEAVAPRFDFADEVELPPKGAAETASKSAGKSPARKLDTVVSVTKSQANQSKGEADGDAGKTKPKK